MDDRGAAKTDRQRTIVEQRSPLERIVKRTFDGPVHVLYEAWSKPELIKSWWVPKSLPITLETCEMDVRPGGFYRFSFRTSDRKQVDFFWPI